MKSNAVAIVSLLFAGFTLFLIIGNNSTDSRIVSNETVLSSSDSSEGIVDEQLGDGAHVRWTNEKASFLSDEGFASSGTLIFQGAASSNLYVDARLTANIGPLSKEVYREKFFLPRQATKYVQVSIGDARGMHEKQFEYATKLLGYVIATHDDAKRQYTQLVPIRFLAYSEASKKYEVLDEEIFNNKYPYGFTTSAGQEMVRRILDETPKNELIEEIGPDIVLEEVR